MVDTTTPQDAMPPIEAGDVVAIRMRMPDAATAWVTGDIAIAMIEARYIRPRSSPEPERTFDVIEIRRSVLWRRSETP